MVYRDKYLSILKDSCNEMRLDYFPQVEASELLYRVITLEDIYLPLRLNKTTGRYSEPGHDLDIDEMIRLIDKKIEELEALEAEETKKVSENISESNSVEKENAETINPTPELYSPFGNKAYIDEMIRRIDEKLAELDASVDERQNRIISEATNPLTARRLLINAEPGSGKTTFCKRLVLALINNDREFLDKYAEENQLRFNRETLPVLISCKNILDLTEQELKSFSFPQLLYKLCIQNLGANFEKILEKDFLDLINTCAPEDLLIIFDGWDEIVDIDRERLFRERFNTYIESHSEVNFLITIRTSYVAPELTKPYSDTYQICELTHEDIHKFCKKWCEVIFASDSQRAQDYNLIAEQIIGSRNRQIQQWMKNPLSLSLLLTVSKNDGRLPENKSELFEELVDLYIYWSINKKGVQLSAKTLRVLLAYIAANFTKNKIFHCEEKELEIIIGKALEDLENAFPENVSSLDLKNVLKEITHTGILKKTYDGRTFSFSENKKGQHRQMQEYLTAYAVAEQYADEEYNNMEPVEIFEDKYNMRAWREIIIFVALMADGRLRQRIIKRLMSKAEENPNDNYVYTNLLFELVVNGVNIRLADKHRIYDIIFPEQITDEQIENITLMLSSGKKNSVDFVEYINEQFSKSVSEGDCKYGYAKATIDAMEEIKCNRSPIAYAEHLMFSQKDEDIVTSTQILLILAWCKYVKIDNVFSSYNNQYKMSDIVAKRFKSLLKENAYRTDIAKSLKDCILANFVTFWDVFNEEDVLTCCKYLSENESTICETILSLVPIYCNYEQNTQLESPQHIKDKYLERLEKEIEKKEYDDVIFTFNLCVVIGCWTEKQFYEKWNLMDELYREFSNNHIGKARYAQISVGYRLFLNGEYKVYADDFSVLIRDAFAFLNPDMKDIQRQDIQRHMNNFAYLLRRREIIKVEKISNLKATVVSPETLLSDGVKDMEAFSIINYALSISGTYRNVSGDFDSGLIFLKNATLREGRDWVWVALWWIKLALQCKEIEGLIVIYWLIELGLVKEFNIPIDKLLELIKCFKKAHKVFKGEDKKCISFLENSLKNQLKSAKSTFTIINDEGVEVDCEILFTFDNTKNGKSYIIYTDNTEDEEGNTKLFASIYKPSLENSVLMPIESEEEWATIEAILGELQRYS